MTHAGDFFARFYIPIIAGVVVAIVAYMLKEVKRDGLPEIGIDIPLTPLKLKLPLPRALKRIWFSRLSLYALAVLLMIWGLDADFSKFFPAHLRMDVFFDELGIQRVLAEFDSSELRSAGVMEGWTACRSKYDESVKSALARSWARIDPVYVSDTAGMISENTHGRGSTSFVVERVGTLAYRIVESRGELQHSADIPGKEIRPFTTFFELRDSPQNHIRPKLLDLVRRPVVMIRPEFKQALSSDPRRGTYVPFDHIMAGMTHVRLLPFPAFGSTVYLWRGSCAGSVPVGYAVYY